MFWKYTRVTFLVYDSYKRKPPDSLINIYVENNGCYYAFSKKSLYIVFGVCVNKYYMQHNNHRKSRLTTNRCQPNQVFSVEKDLYLKQYLVDRREYLKTRKRIDSQHLR